MLDFFGPITPVVLIGAIFGMVEIVKQFGVAGKWATLASLVCGVALGVLYQLQIPYFEVGFYGLLLGLTASGFYAVGMRFADRANGG